MLLCADFVRKISDQASDLSSKKLEESFEKSKEGTLNQHNISKEGDENRSTGTTKHRNRMMGGNSGIKTSQNQRLKTSHLL
jgi:hypothetical protein